MTKMGNYCSRCGGNYPSTASRCPTDGVLLSGTMNAQHKRPVTAKQISAIHARAMGQKGLCRDDYKARLLRVTKKSSSNSLTQGEFTQFMNDLDTLPDVPTWKSKQITKWRASHGG